MKPRADDLEERVASRKRELIMEILEHKKNSLRAGAGEAIDKIKGQLLELSQILNASEVAHLGTGARLRLAQWVVR
ncbi:MAG: hypothetical protein JO257_00160 [Deltaproteobacteria bacterium]|nr:hypothetical protein [Deltaproteobacteria bacterium]